MQDKREDLRNDAALMSIKSMQDGGMLKGPSHKDGGILTQVGDQPIEMEGGEYVIKKSSAKKLGKKTLDKINSTGKLPEMAQGGGLYANIHAKRKRIKKGSGEKMRKPGSKGAPTNANFKRAAKTAKMQEGGYIEDENNDPNYMGMTSDAMSVYGDIKSLERTGGVRSMATGLSLGATGAEYAGKGASRIGKSISRLGESATSALGSGAGDPISRTGKMIEKAGGGLGKVSTGLGGASSILSGAQAFDVEDETGLTQAQGAYGIAKGASEIAGVTVGKKVGEQVLGKAAPGLNIASGVRDILSEDSTAVDKVGGAASVATGVAGAGALATGAGSVAATNFWNPVGWAAGAVAIGATAASLMGIGKKARDVGGEAAKIRI
jgi:hypothetical protein